uniref:RING-type domain-containing protein n=2 Tax=Octactis speculum TaxID=3111310 RepID=A0A7S2BY27_9STRA
MFNPVEMAEIPAQMDIISFGTHITVRRDPAFDDASIARSSQPDHMLPMSTVRGRNGGYDDVIQIRHTPSAIGTDCPEGRFSWLEVLEPIKGWVLDTEIERSPSPEQQVSGPPSWRVGSVTVTQGGVTEASRWIYAVVCEDGALVRSGLDLSSSHTYTLRMHALVEISERKFNEQGLARLRTADKKGWISEQLNPLSGHRGPVVVLVPMPAVLEFNVALPEGAVVRRTCELSSPITKLVPFQGHVNIDRKCFSDHPANHCIPRMKLADGSGWVSQKLNREPPNDSMVLALLGYANPRDSQPHPPLPPPPSGDRQRAVTPQNGTESSTDWKISGALAGMKIRGSSSKDSVDEEGCVVCLAAPRSATIVHSGTGHIACCMECARVLKARGDRCPVCRMEIDLVIQHFWA